MWQGKGERDKETEGERERGEGDSWREQKIVERSGVASLITTLSLGHQVLNGTLG